MANHFLYNKKEISVGDTVAVQQKIQEGDKTRYQPFQGVVIAIKGQTDRRSFTVRKISTASVGVERIWPVNSPWINNITVKKHGQARRAKLYFLRDRTGKAAIKVPSTTLRASKSKE
jgi:large subunit ribosomal protein L19